MAGRRVAVTSCVEHPATAEPLRVLEESGWSVTRAAVDDGARLTPEAIAAFPGRIALVSLILAQNEVGTIQPVRAFAEAVHAAEGGVHTDAAQAVGKIDVDVEELGGGLLRIAGHKLCAPKGIGALYVRRGTPLAALLVGPVRNAGYARAPRTSPASSGSDARPIWLAAMPRTTLVVSPSCANGSGNPGLSGASGDDGGAAPEARFMRLSPENDCLPGTLMVTAPGVLGRDVLATAPELEASTGSACHAGVDSPAATLLAMGLDDRTALGAIRLSLGHRTNIDDVDLAAAALRRALGEVRS